MLEIETPSEDGAESLLGQAASPEGLLIADAGLLFNADFARLGDDLRLTGPDGSSQLVEDYFLMEPPAALVSPAGAQLTPNVVFALAGRGAVQIAQSSEIATDGQPAAAGEAIGHVETLSGTAQAMRGGMRVELGVGDPVFANDVLTTGGGSALGIAFVDQTVFAMSANARMVLDSLVYNPGGSGNSLVVSVVQGSFVFITGEIAPTGGVRVETPVASIGIRGTMGPLTIKAINGETDGSLLVDPTGHLGSYGVYDKLTGELVATIDQTTSLWSLTNAGGTLRYQMKTQFDFVSDANLVGFATSTYHSSRGSQPRRSNSGPNQQGQRSSLEDGDVLETAAGPSSFGGGSSYEATNFYGSRTGSLFGSSSGFSSSTSDAASIFSFDGQPVSLPLPASTASSSPPPPPAPSSSPAAPNTPPTAVALDNASIDEGSAGAVVGAITVVDPDSGESFTYAVSDDRFEVAGGQLRLKDGQVLDFEAEPVIPLTVTITDSAGNQLTQAFEIAVTDQSDPPVVDLNGPEPGVDAAAGFAEGDQAVALAGLGAAISDDDSATLASLTVTITNLQDGAAELLAVSTAGTAVVADYDGASGVLTLSGGASLAEYQQVLATLTYQNGSEDPTAGVRTVEVTAEDGGGLTSQVATIAVTVSAVNDVPILGNNSLAIGEGDSVILTSANLSADDADNAELTYTVSAVQAGQFELLSAPGAAIVSFSQAELDAGQVLFAHDGSETAPGFLISVSDGVAATDPAAAAITFISVNGAPAVDLNGTAAGIDYSAVFLAGEGPVGAVDPGVTIADADSANLSGLTITLTNAADGAAESLSVSLEAAGALGIAVSGNGTASLTLSGAASPADYQELLSTLSYDNTSASPTEGVRTIEIQADDGSASNNLSLVAVSSIAVTAADAQPPVLTINQMMLDEGGVVVLSSAELAATDPDGNEAGLVFTVSGVTGGQFELVAAPGNAITSFTQAEVTAGAVRFVHDGGESSPAYEVSVSDGLLATAPAAAGVSFATENDAPLLTANSLTLLEGETVILTTANLNASDPDSVVLTFTASGVQNGQFEMVADPGVAVTSFTLAEVAADQVRFVHDGGEAAPAYQVTVSDGSATTEPASAVIEFSTENDPPLAFDDALATDEDNVLSGNVLADNGSGADNDPDGDTLTVSAVNGVPADVGSPVTLASGALLTLNGDGTFDYDPNGQFESLGGGNSAEDSFSYTISDGNGGIDTATVSVTVNGVNGAPEVVSDTAVVVKGAALAISSSLLSASDAETSDAALITFTVSSQVAGAVLLSGLAAASFTLADILAGLVTFQHDDSDGAAAGFTVVASDPDGGASAAVALSFTVSAGFMWTNGAGDGDWDNAANWASNSVPGDGAIVVIEDQAGEVIFSTGTASLSSLTLAGDTLNITGGTFAVTDFTWSGGSLAGAGGTMTVSGEASLGGGAALTLERELVLDGTTTLAGALVGGGSLVNAGDLTVVGATLVALPFVNMEGASVTVAGMVGDAAGVLELTGGFDQAGTITLTSAEPNGVAALIVTGGPLDNQGTIVTEGDPAGAHAISADLVNNGEMTFNAATVIIGSGGEASNEAAATFTANADVTLTGTASFRNSGAMSVAAAATFALVAGDFENALGGVIGGGGTIEVGGTLTNNGTINPGTSPGALAIEGDFVQGAGGQLIVEIDGSGGDILSITGTATFAGTIAVTLLDGYTPPAGQTITFVTAAAIVDNGYTVTGLTYTGGLLGLQMDGGTASLVAVSGSGDVLVGPDAIIVGEAGVGSLAVDAGQVLTTLYLSVGEEATGVGSLVLTNASQLTVEGASYIGNFGSGEATISGGAQALFQSDNFNNLIIAGQAGSTGSLVIAGAGTTVTTAGVDNAVLVGHSGSGSLTVQDGAALSTLYLEAGTAGGQGTVIIQGAGTLVTASNDDGRFPGVSDPFAGQVSIGRAAESNGLLQVLNGARLEIRNGEGENEDTTDPGLDVADHAGSIGSVLIDGTGSVIAISQTVPADPENERFGSFVRIGVNGTGVMTIQNGGQLDLTGDSPSFQLGRFATGAGSLLVDGPGSSVSLTGPTPFVSIGRAGDGAVSLTNNAEFVVSGTGSFLEVGRENGAIGVLTIQSGSELSLQGGNDDTRLRIGRFAGSEGSVVVDGEGSLLSVGGTNELGSFGNRIEIGSEGTGILQTLNGATVIAERISVGFWETGVGAAVVDNASWLVTGETLQVGREGDGTLTIQNGGVVTVDAEFSTIGDAGGSSGVVTVDATSSLSYSGDLAIGHGAYDPDPVDGFGQDAEAFGAMNILGGAVTAQFVGIGGEARGRGTVLVDGEGALLDVGGELDVGQSGEGTLTIANGGAVTSENVSIARDKFGVGMANVDGGTWNILGEGLSVGQQGVGTLNILNGGEVTVAASLSSIADTGGSTGTVNVDATSSLSFAGDLSVGAGFFDLIGSPDYGQDAPAVGTLNILGGTVIAQSVGIGTEARGHGAVMVDGEGAFLDVGGELNVGQSGEGGLTIANGGAVISGGTSIARDKFSVGTATVDGGTWSVSGEAFHVGQQGIGILSVLNGGAVTVAAGFSSIADTGGSTGTVNVDGTSSLSFAGFLIVGNGSFAPVDAPDYGQDAEAFGTLNILGGTVTAAGASVGDQTRGRGTVLVDGDGALFAVADTLVIAAEGQGTVTVGNGGTLQVGTAEDDDIDIFINAGGTLEIQAGGTVIGDIANNGGTLINGNSPGTASFGGDFIMTGGVLQVELAGTAAGDFDLYQVAGEAALQGGILEISIIDGYDPLAGDTFTFLTAGAGLVIDDGALSFIVRGVAENFDFDVIFTGGAAEFTVLGGGAGDSVVFLGGPGGDIFIGGSGNDRLDGGGGRDSLAGGDGSDLFILRAAETLEFADIISDFEVGVDSLGLADGLSAGELTLTATDGGDTAVMLQSTGAYLAVLQGISPIDISIEDLAAVV